MTIVINGFKPQALILGRMKAPAHVARAFGQAVREYRLKKGMPQQEVADKCGLDISYVGGIERGQRNPTLGAILGIASVLGVKASELLRKANS